jgi:hypothetical protein
MDCLKVLSKHPPGGIEEQNKTAVMISGKQTQIRTGFLLVTTIDHCRTSVPLCPMNDTVNGELESMWMEVTVIYFKESSVKKRQETDSLEYKQKCYPLDRDVRYCLHSGKQNLEETAVTRRGSDFVPAVRYIYLLCSAQDVYGAELNKDI